MKGGDLMSQVAKDSVLRLRVLETSAETADVERDTAPPEGGERRPLRDLLEVGKLAGKSLVGAVRSTPGALRREYEYCTGRRRSGNLILTWGCTSKCANCTVWRRTRHRERELSCEEWIDVARQLADLGVETVELFGGDIFLRKDVVVPLARELKSHGIDVHVPTNSNLVDRETAEALADCLSCVYISTDGVDELHDQLRGVRGTFGRLNNCLTYFLEARGDRRKPTLICNTTVSQGNVHDLARIAEFASKAGYDGIDLEYVGEFNEEIISRSKIGHYVPSPIFVHKGESNLVRKETVSVLRHQLGLARRYERPKDSPEGRFRVNTINTDVLTDSDVVNGTIPGRRCFIERAEIVIDPYGNIVPCFFFDTYSMGNVRDGALRRSLETPERGRFRSYREHGQLKMCNHCIHTVVRNRTAVDTIKREFIERFRHRRTTA